MDTEIKENVPKTEKQEIIYKKTYTKDKDAINPDDFINAILDMRDAIDNGGIDIIETKLSMHGTEFYLSAAELLHLALDGDFLKRAIQQENVKLEDVAKTLTTLIEELYEDEFNPISRVNLWQVKANLQQIKEHKKKIDSLNCKLHGHNFADKKEDNSATCKNCGETYTLDNKKKDKNTYLKITFTEEFANAIREIREKIEETGLSLLIMDLKMKSISFDVTPSELLHLALDKNYLQREIDRTNKLMSVEVSKLAKMRKQGIDITSDTESIKKIKIDLSNYNEQRNTMTSLMSDLHGPVISNDRENDEAAPQNVDITLSQRNDGTKIFEKIRPTTARIKK